MDTIIYPSKRLSNKYSISFVVNPSGYSMYKTLEERQGARSGCKGDLLLEESTTASRLLQSTALKES